MHVRKKLHSELQVASRAAGLLMYVRTRHKEIRETAVTELGSTLELEYDQRCFEHVLTHSNRLV